jgi:hypothetical protein
MRCLSIRYWDRVEFLFSSVTIAGSAKPHLEHRHRARRDKGLSIHTGPARMHAGVLRGVMQDIDTHAYRSHVFERIPYHEARRG